jgi:hypothetical protein
VRSLLQIAIDSGIVLTEEMALADYHYWINRGDVKPHRYYAKRWRWGESKVYRFITKTVKQDEARVKQDEARVCDSVADSWGNEAEVKQDEARVKQYVEIPDREEQQKHAPERGSAVVSSKIHHLPATARVAVADNPPSVEDVIAHGVIGGVGRELCERFHGIYTTQGWVRGNGMLIYDWRPLLAQWKLSESEKNTPVRTQSKNAVGKNGAAADPEADEDWGRMSRGWWQQAQIFKLEYYLANRDTPLPTEAVWRLKGLEGKQPFPFHDWERQCAEWDALQLRQAAAASEKERSMPVEDLPF